MNPHPVRRPDFYAGSNWLRWAIFVAAVAVFSLWLLAVLRQMQALGEKTMMEQTVLNIRTGLKVAMSEAVISQRGREIAGWAGRDPVRWLAAPPAGYAGECKRSEGVAAGAWCFESSSGDLVYRPRNPQGLKRLDENGVVVVAEPIVLRWRVVMAGQDERDAVAWLRVQNITPYVWSIE